MYNCHVSCDFSLDLFSSMTQLEIMHTMVPKVGVSIVPTHLTTPHHTSPHLTTSLYTSPQCTKRKRETTVEQLQERVLPYLKNKPQQLLFDLLLSLCKDDLKLLLLLLQQPPSSVRSHSFFYSIFFSFLLFPVSHLSFLLFSSHSFLSYIFFNFSFFLHSTSVLPPTDQRAAAPADETAGGRAVHLRF